MTDPATTNPAATNARAADDDAPELCVFYGRASPAEVQVYARWGGFSSAAGAQPRLRGEIRGPLSAYAQTLPACVRLAEQGGAPPLATCCLPDPCFWSPQAPYLYRVDVTGEDAAGSPFHAQRLLGVRPCGAHGTQFLWEGKRFVPRWVAPPAGAPLDWQACRATDAALWLEEPADAACEAASRLGVLLGAWLTPRADCTRDVLRLARWPAVAFLALEQRLDDDDFRRLRSLAPNLLLGQRWNAAAPPAAGAQFVVVDVQALAAQRSWALVPPLPLVVQGDSSAADVAARRSACDELQRRLVGQVDPAGYIV